jgi:hypothetical protein
MENKNVCNNYIWSKLALAVLQLFLIVFYIVTQIWLSNLVSSQLHIAEYPWSVVKNFHIKL